MNNTVAIVLGAFISGMVGVLVVIVQQRLARQHELDTARARRLGEFSAAGWAATLSVSALARAPLDQKAEIEEAEALQSIADRFNSALAQIQLLDTGDVYVAAHNVDACLVRLIRDAGSGQFDADAWRAKRAKLAQAVAEYQRAARKVLGSPSAPQLISRPSPQAESEGPSA